MVRLQANSSSNSDDDDGYDSEIDESGEVDVLDADYGSSDDEGVEQIYDSEEGESMLDDDSDS